MHRPPSLIEGFSRGTHLLRAGLCAEALPEFQAAYAEADELGDIDIMAACLCEMAWCSYKLGRAEEALECAMGAQRLQERQGNQGELARALAVEAIVFLDLGFSDEAYELSVRAVELAETGDDTALLAFTLNAKGVVLAVCHEAELGITLLQRAVTLAHAQDNAAAEAYYQLNLGFCHARIAEENARIGNASASAMRDVAIALFDRSVALAEASGDQWTLRVALGNAAELHSIQGRLDAARQNLSAIEAIAADPGTSLRIHYLYTLSDVLLRSGTPREARAAALEALSLAEASQQIDHQVNVLGKLTEIHEALGETADALAAFKRFHASYVQQSGETARRRARIEEIRTEARQLRSEAATLSGLALTDALTGIANRRSFDMILNRLAGTAISLAIIDLDHFKSVNDDHSHLVGDAVLRRVASVIVSQVGPHGHAARLGGEEFALIFPDAPEASAAAFCEGIRFAISDTEWSDLAPGLKVTASIGLASGDGSTPSSDLMQTADSRLYIAKTNGRDRVVFSDALVILPAGKPGSRRRWRA